MECALYYLMLLILGILMSIEAHLYDKTVQSISSREPIINETTYSVYPNLWCLDMSNSTAYEFPVNRPFLAHQRLVRYICNNCSIGSIHRESLTKLLYLSRLELTNNNLTYIHPDAFEKNPLLECLLLSYNHLLTFNPETTLRHLPQLVELDLSYNVGFDLNTVKIVMKSLITFICRNCATTILNASTMAKMPRLYNLTLPNNHLEHIEENTFAVAGRFMALNIDGNRQLRRLNFHSKTLRYLSAQKCKLEGTLDTSAVPQLNEINVRGNHLTHINEHGFHSGIQTILLDDNEIQNIPTQLLMLPFNHLRTLCLDRNPLQPCTCADEAIERYKSRQLRNGCLNDNSNINKFEAFLPNKTGFALYISNNVERIDESDTKLDLSNKNIVAIEQDYLKKFISLIELIFDNNIKFDFKPHEPFLGSTSLTQLSIRNCSITEIGPATFRELPNLQTIDMEYNHIQSMTNRLVFRNNKNLLWLSLAHNNIILLHSSVFKHLDGLKTLHLSGNKHLASNPDTPFVFSYTLEDLLCNHCGFSQLDDVTLSSLPNLTQLDLSYNQIRTVDSNSFKSNTNLKYVNLRGNDLLSFEPEALKLPSFLVNFCIAETTTIASQFNESHVTKETIERMIRLQKECGDGTIIDELTTIYSARVTQAGLISASHNQNVSLARLIVATSESSTVRSFLPVVICLVTLVNL